MSELRERYRTEVVPALRKEFQYPNAMQVPRLTKIVVNIGLGEALRDAKAVDAAVNDLTLITGQKPVVTRAKKALQAGSVKARDSLAGPARIVGRALVSGSSIEDVEAWPERIGAVTVADVNAAAKAVFDIKYSVTGILLPKAGK